MRRPFSFVKRSLSGGVRYYIRFWLADESRYSTARSAGSLADLLKIDTAKYRPNTKAGAEYIAAQVMGAGGYAFILKSEAESPDSDASILTTPEIPDESNPLIIPFLLHFWDFEKSEYVADRLEHRKRIGKLYCLNNQKAVDLHLKKFIHADEKFLDLTPLRLKRIQSQVKNEKKKNGAKLSASAVNSIMAAITIPIQWLHKMGVLPTNPASILEEYENENTGKKGILSSAEARRLFSSEWDDDRARLAVTLAYYTGARLGELASLYRSDLDVDFAGKPVIWIRSSWSEIEGRKSTKNTKSRIVPIPQTLADELKKLYDKNPTDSPFLFWDALDEKKPFSRKMIEGAFNRQLAKIGIPEDVRKTRRLSMHSLRHGFNAMLRGAIPDETLRKATGHLTASLTDYYDHTTESDLEAIREAQETRILHFPKEQAK